MPYSFKSAKAFRIRPRSLLWLAGGLLLLYVVSPQLGLFRDSFVLLSTAQGSWLAVGLAATIGTYIAAAAIYKLLAKHSLLYVHTLLIQVASMFANRLLPAGAGALGVNYAFLRHHKHTQSEAVAVVAMNNTLGFIGNMLLLVCILLTTSIRPQRFQMPHLNYLGFAIAGLLFMIVAWLVRRFRDKIHRFLREVIVGLIAYRYHLPRLLLALAASMALTILYTLCLQASLLAVHIHLPIAMVFVVMTLGVTGSTVAPTPGGLGGAEAGLLGGLVLYGASGSDALAAVLLYRIGTYWLPLVFGGVAFAAAVQRRYI